MIPREEEEEGRWEGVVGILAVEEVGGVWEDFGGESVGVAVGEF